MIAGTGGQPNKKIPWKPNKQNPLKTNEYHMKLDGCFRWFIFPVSKWSPFSGTKNRSNFLGFVLLVIFFTGFYHGKSSPLNHHHSRESTVSFGNWLCRHHTRTRRISASIRPGFANLPARMAEQASAMYAQNMANLLRHVHAKGRLNSIGKGKFEAHLQKGWSQKKCHTLIYQRWRCSAHFDDFFFERMV